MTSIRSSSEPAPIFAAAACIASIGRAIRRASTKLVATARIRNATSNNAVRQMADLSGANASLSGSSTKTRQPSESMVWYALSTFVPSGSRPIVAASSGLFAGPLSASRTCGSEAKLVRLRTRLRSGWATSSTGGVDGVRVSRRSDPRTVDHLADEAQVDLGDHDAASGCTFGHGDRHARLGA